ncbi:AAA domain-containing protein [Catellatospora sp. NPDC049111]|uniref:DEAD/DEAH box helicase n=1 Tax=Catellatospora sp. NPDC049111 TaxID=3155271 RepID=UPI0033D7EAF9
MTRPSSRGRRPAGAGSGQSRPPANQAAAGSSGPPLAPLPGAATLVSLEWQLHGAPPSVVADRTEAVLTRSPGGGVVVEIDGRSAMASGFTTTDDDTLRQVMQQVRSRVAMVLVLDPQPRGSRWARLDLNIYVYDKGPTDQPLTIGVTDKEFASIHRAAEDRHRRRSQEWALAWLRDRLVLPPRPGAAAGSPDRIVISAGPRRSADEPVGFRIHGRGLSADVRIVDNRVMLSRVVLRGHDTQQGPLRLVERAVTFADVSRATILREEMKHQLAKLASGEGFLAMWNSYNRKESWWAHRRVRDSGYLKFERVARRHDGVLRFHVSVPTGPDDGRLSLLDLADVGDDEPMELEASAELPSALLREPAAEHDWGLLDDQLPADHVSGTVVAASTEASTIDLRMMANSNAKLGQPIVQPPNSGFLYRAFRGDRRRLMRRREAFDRILKGRTRIPNLLTLLEGDPVPAPPPTRWIDPKSDAAWACFKGGRPTLAQQRALDVALNTPDIAIIQGPPGTGKTQLIAALQARLAESGRGFAQLRGSMLLTSYQHAAVDELVQRSTVFGLPANKVDRTDRGATVQIDRWRTATIEHLDDRLRQSPAGPGVVALRRAAGLAAGYLLAPTDLAATESMLQEIIQLADGLASDRLVDRLRHQLLLTRAPKPHAWGSDAEELAIVAVRGLRVTATAFLDDGPAAAAKALRRVTALADVELPATTAALLAAAAAWGEAEPPPFLADLEPAQTALLEMLAQPNGPSPAATVDPALRQLLEELMDEMAQRVAESPGDGLALALLDYREAIHGDPAAVDWTLREYTASYAATCQQVASPGMARVKGESRVDDIIFDTVIVDEAARANPLDLMIPLIHAGRRIILVGDHNQLPQMLEPDVEREFEPDMRRLLSESLFQRLFESLNRPGSPVARVVTLDTQFRMHQVLGQFVSRNFYGGKLDSVRPDADFVHHLPRYGDAVAVWLDVPPQAGPESGERSKSRVAEAQAVAAEVKRLVDEAPDLTIGVISFYSGQVKEIYRQLAAQELLTRAGQGYEPVERLRYKSSGERLDRLMVGTVDAFQGKEFDIVLLSMTRCSPRHGVVPDPASPEYHRWAARRYGHLTLINRLCVAMSRQQRVLIAVGAAAMFDGPQTPAALGPVSDFLRICRGGGPHGVFVS